MICPVLVKKGTRVLQRSHTQAVNVLTEHRCWADRQRLLCRAQGPQHPDTLTPRPATNPSTASAAMASAGIQSRDCIPRPLLPQKPEALSRVPGWLHPGPGSALPALHHRTHAAPRRLQAQLQNLPDRQPSPSTAAAVLAHQGL